MAPHLAKRFAAFFFACSASLLCATEPIDDALTAYEHGDYAKAETLLRPLADQGDTRAQFNLWAIYANRHGAGANTAEAIQWLRKSADGGYASAQYSLGELYENGRGVPKDLVDAARWYNKAAGQGNVQAEFRLAIMYETGAGVTQDIPQAMHWLRSAADQGSLEAQTQLGRRYIEGRGVPKDAVAGVEWLRKAAAHGYPPAQVYVGVAYEQGIGVATDLSEAVTWYRKAAEQGLAGAQRFLADMYAQGRGTSRDLNEAIKWYEKAANQGDKYSLTRLDSARAALRGEKNEQGPPAAVVVNAKPGDRYALVLKEVFPGQQTWKGYFIVGQPDVAHPGAFSIAELTVSIGTCKVVNECTYSTPKTAGIFFPSGKRIESGNGEKPPIAHYSALDTEGKFLGDFSISGEEWGAYNTREPRFARNGSVSLEAAVP